MPHMQSKFWGQQNHGRCRKKIIRIKKSMAAYAHFGGKLVYKKIWQKIMWGRELFYKASLGEKLCDTLYGDGKLASFCSIVKIFGQFGYFEKIFLVQSGTNYGAFTVSYFIALQSTLFTVHTFRLIFIMPSVVKCFHLTDHG
eukprot:TRINITY_DN9945_c0_g3_i2.p2 TRINITY_DN9945_c0_g3~~TRINITY_DN9945_c0_g3_i2.p2  ORF type:complete len:142 (-),score=0.05 TRINITY_DN9945_c0_g3_i2:202-627(-)